MGEIKIVFDNSFAIPGSEIKSIPENIKAEIYQAVQVKCASLKDRIEKANGTVIFEYSEKPPYRPHLKTNGNDPTLSSEFLDFFSHK